MPGSTSPALSRAALVWVALAAVLLGGCNTEPIKDEKANVLLAACCEAARSRIELANDVETSKFRDRCGSCKVGKSKGDCEAAARRVMGAVTRAYSAEMLPAECSTLRAELGELGISIPAIP
ncbi:MAG: hypothetical protein HY898_31520 [Deltaproteobacteria bacterium]|nr:hypothetical protein [Deltaproteobacteria bacterium]